MSKFSSRQWIAIAGGIIFFTLLFFINRKAPSVAAPAQDSGHVGNTVDFDEVIKESEDSLPSPDRKLATRIETTLANSPDSVHPHLLAELVKIFDSINQPIISAYYTGKLAALLKSAPLWTHAGQQFYDYSSLSRQEFKDMLIAQATTCFNNALRIDSTIADAQVGLGECLVDGSNPMQGIGTIMKVIQKDSNNRNAQIALGKFSIRSGQLDKAIYRFNRALAIDPNYKEGYIFLAEIYDRMGNKKEEIVNLKKYRIFAPDSAVKMQIDSIIKSKE